MSERIKGWHRADVLAEVRKRGSTLAAIAAANGLARQTLYWAFISPRLRANRVIAEFLGVPLHELWPQWFDEDGKLVSTQATPRPEINRISRGSHPSRPRRRAA